MRFIVAFGILAAMGAGVDDPPAPLIEIVRIKLDSPVRAAMSRDGSKVACAGDDGVLRIFDPLDGREAARSEPMPRVVALAFSADGEWLASAGGRKPSPSEPPKPLTGVKVMPPGGGRGLLQEEDFKLSRMLSMNLDGHGLNFTRDLENGYVHIVKTSDGSFIRRFDDFERPVEAVSFDRERDHLTAVDTDFRLIRKDLRGGKDVSLMSHHGIRILDFPSPQSVFSGDGLVIASVACEKSSRDILVKVFDGRGPKFRVMGPEDGCGQPWSIAMSSDGGRVFLGGRGGSLDIWRIDPLGLERSIPMDLIEGDAVGFVALDPAGRRVFVGNLGGRIGVWDSATCRRIASSDGPRRDFRAVAFRGTRVRILSGGFRRNGGKTDDLLVQDFETAPPAGP